MRKFFAVRDRAEDRLVAYIAAAGSEGLDDRFPDVDFEIVDMTGKGPPPHREGSAFEDLTVELGEWKWKVTEAEADLRAYERRALSLRSQLVSLLVKKEKAEALGIDYEDAAAAFQARIAEVEAELAGL